MWPINLPSLFFTLCRIFLSSLTVRNTSSFLTWSVQIIASVLLQHHTSVLSRYFLYNFGSVQFSAPCSSVLQMQHFTPFFLKFKYNLLVERVFLLNDAFATAILDLISRVYMKHDFLQIIYFISLFCNCSTCFWRITRPSSGALSSILYNAVQSAQSCRRARLACMIVPTAWYSIIDIAPDDGRVLRPKPAEQVQNSEIKKIICKKSCILLVHIHTAIWCTVHTT